MWGTRLTASARLLAAVTIAFVLPVASSGAARADVVRNHADPDGSGWYPDAPGLSPAIVTGGTFGKLFSASVTGQVYAQPLVDDDTVLVATEGDVAYGLDPRDGTQRWKTGLGTPWDPANLGCADLTPAIGVTGTPVVDSATGIEYVVAKTALPANPSRAAYTMHALDVVTGAEQPGFPVAIGGSASNAPNVRFDATEQLQRPGLLLLNGIVYAAFGGHCDHSPYTGWVAGVSTAGRVTTMWATQATGADGAGIWQSGGAILADGPNHIILATGNGHLIPTGPTPGNLPPADLSEAVVRLTVLPDQTLHADDFFTPYDAPALDVQDADFGSGGPVALPESYAGTPLFGTTAHPHLMLEEGKEGYVYLLDRDDLGGFRAGPAGSDAALGRIGPYGGVWSTPAVWPGNGGYVYIVHTSGVTSRSGYLRAYHYGLDDKGNPTLSMVAQSPDPFGLGSGAPVVTSDGLDPSSALLWTVWQPDGSGAGAQLRAYDPSPSGGLLRQIWSAPIGTGVKFAPPAVSGNRVYVGTRDGTVLGFGAPVDQPLVASPGSLYYAHTIVGQSTTQPVTFHATAPVTLDSLDSTGSAFTIGTPSMPLPAQLNPGDTLTVPITFAPTTRGLVSGTVTAVTEGGPDVPIALEGIGQLATGDLSAFPGQLSLGGVAIGGSSISATVAFSNVGAATLHVTGSSVPPPSSDFTVVGLPRAGTAILPGGSVLATVTFTPRARGLFSGTIRLSSDAPAPATSFVAVPVSASAAPAAHLVVDRTTTYLGALRVGANVTTTVRLKNTGGTSMVITKSKPPARRVGFAPASQLDEGTNILPGQSMTLRVSFRASRTGHFTDTWVINGDDNSGAHTVTFDAYVTNVRAAYWLLDRDGGVHPEGGAVALGSPTLSGTRAVTLAPTPSGGGYYVLDDRGRVFTYGDARGRGNIPVAALRSGERATTMSLTPSGGGYWLFTSAGRAFRYGDAAPFGDLGGQRLNGPIVSSVATPGGGGYYMVASDGGVFAFGDARFRGSMGNTVLNRPVVGLVPTPSGKGYWLVASDGGVFAFGDARFRGSMASTRLNAPIAGMVRYDDGYLMVASDGGIFDFSSETFLGSLADHPPRAPIVGVGAFTT
jgi:iron transport multicopper oxidase